MGASRSCPVFFLFLLTFAYPVIGQDQDLLKKVIRLKPGLTRLDSLLQFASQQTGVVFSFNSKKLDTHQHIRIKGGALNLDAILALLKEEKGFSIKIIENYIVINSTTTREAGKKIFLKSATPQQFVDHNKLKKVNIQNSITEKRNTNTKENPTYTSPKTDSSLKQELKKEIAVIIMDSTKTNNVDNNPAALSTIKPLPNNINDSTKITSTKVKSEKKVTNQKEKLPKTPIKNTSFFLKPGISADESFLLGTLIQFGLPVFYGTVSANTNFNISQIRYGLGTSLKVNDNLRLHLNFNLGDLQKSGVISDSSAYDKFPITIKSKLNRIGIAAEFSLSKKLLVQVGPVFNQLKTNYFINSVPNSLRIFTGNGDKEFYTVNPPYLISNSYSSTSNSNIKTWVGLQVNLLYFLNF
jgi:hypothetical protein